MDERALATYMNDVLKLDPIGEAESIVAARAAFVDPSVIVALEASINPLDRQQERAAVRWHLQELRRVFWQIDDADLERRLTWLARKRLPETASQLERMRQAAAHRPAMRTLIAERQIPFSFLASFGNVLIAPAREANLWRERIFSAMRPERNIYYPQAQSVTKNAVLTIRSRFPYLYAMEDGWLNEILEFKDGDSTAMPADSFESMALLGVIGATLAAMIGVGFLLSW